MGETRQDARPLRVAFVGAGKVGCSLARFLAGARAGDVASAEEGQPAGGPGRGAATRSGVPVGSPAPDPAPCEVVGFFSRTPEHALEAAEFAGGVAFGSAADAACAADVLVVTTPDAQIAPAWERVADAARAGELSLAGKVVAHCSGALPASMLTGAHELGARACSVHPLYAMSSRFGCWQELAHAWFSLEGDEGACALMERLLAARGARCGRVRSEEKARYHAAAVMASNLVAGLYARAAAELKRAGWPTGQAEAALAPLFEGNARHVARDGVGRALTGPAARGDEATIARHLDVLEGSDREIYRLLTNAVRQVARRGRDQADPSERKDS